MRFMGIPSFPRSIEIPNLESLIRTRLSQEIVIWLEQAIPLLGYMGWPNHAKARSEAKRILRGWSEGVEVLPPRLRRIQADWTRVADILSLHYDIFVGGHQVRRRGSSIAKAIALAEANSATRGLGVANLWNCWKAYKDVAHLVTAASIVCSEVRCRAKRRSSDKPFGEFGLDADQFQPFTITMIMPNLVLAVALWWQDYGLTYLPHSRSEPILDPATVWRIRRNINVTSVPPPQRKLRPQDILLLNKRRAHKGCRASQSETTPVSG
jgi:hypothetical protein